MSNGIKKLINKNFIFNILLLLVFGHVVRSEELGLMMNAPVLNSELASVWVMTLQKAYDSFLSIMYELTRSTVASVSLMTSDFESAAKTCFSLVKGRVLNSSVDFKFTAKAVSSTLAKTVVYGIRAVGELAVKGEIGLAQKLATTLDLMQNALELTYNLLPYTN